MGGSTARTETLLSIKSANYRPLVGVIADDPTQSTLQHIRTLVIKLQTNLLNWQKPCVEWGR